MPRYFEFEVTLQEISPRIWRRFLIHDKARFSDLHRAIQDSMGWEDCHLWEFVHHDDVQRKIAGLPEEAYEGEPTPDAAKIELSSHFGAKAESTRCIYIYDYGDYWLHDVVLKQVIELDERFQRRLLDGARACPPEDCGSSPGYQRLVELLKTGKDPYGEDEGELIEWLGDWSPNEFDLSKRKRAFDS